MTSRLYIDTDNAMGARAGDVDDGFALIALLNQASLEIVAVGSVFGNSSSHQALSNNRALADLLDKTPELWLGACRKGELDSEVAQKLALQKSLRIAALGPLTNLAGALRHNPSFAKEVKDCVIVGSRRRAFGRFPPYLPHEFNLTKDRRSTQVVFESALPLTLIPLDVACTIRTSMKELTALKGDLGGYVRQASRAWALRCRLLKWRADFPVWDLAAAGYLLRQDLYEVEEIDVRVDRRGMVFFGRGGRKMRVVKHFDAPAIWKWFLSTANSVK